jgi:hypothetical protein
MSGAALGAGTLTSEAEGVANKGVCDVLSKFRGTAEGAE